MLVHAFALICLLPQGPTGDESVPRGLTVVVVDVGQGDGAVIKAPDGTVHVIDAGRSGSGARSMVGVIRAMKPKRLGSIIATHFDADHIGGVPGILATYSFPRVIDRGDEARKSNKTISRYLAAVAGRRQTAREGQVYQLGGGAVLTVLAVNGRVRGGAHVVVASKAQEENARSVAMRLDYGDFSMWLGGDLTGGGLRTPDVETAAAKECGDVDVYKVDHHGSSTSTNANLMRSLDPELALVSCGGGNSYGHPTDLTVGRINRAAAARAFLATTTGGGSQGFSAAGTVTLDTDGRRYRATTVDGRFLEMFVDEVTGRSPTASDLRVAEIHRHPAQALDDLGEWFELVNIGPAPVSLSGVEIGSRSGAFTLASPLVLTPGRPLLFCADGNPSRNGDLSFGFVWPRGSLSLGEQADVLTLQHDRVRLDTVDYAAGFPGGRGVSAERRDLRGKSGSANFFPATVRYGTGDLGTPGAPNTADRTRHPATLVVEAAPKLVEFHVSALSHSGKVSVVGLAMGISPGFSFLGRKIPLNLDLLLRVVLGVPGFAQVMPAPGYRSYRMPLPLSNPLKGVRAHAVHIMIDAGHPASIPVISSPVAFVFP
ncbi:MAG: MBL fold metallo-hydrolase [Planctomycetota bacterium]|jgi:beta-lactamase superfamily II metal-dependent hydrolase|nr:MBL fold metallo-hydrolase [Planctomycetota bacterium]